MSQQTLTAAESRVVIELLPDILLFADPHRRIRTMSRSPWSNGFQNRIGKDFLEFVSARHQPMMRAAVERVLAGESLVELEFEGAITGRWVRARVGAVRDGGRVTELILHLRDVEELMLLEHERARLQAAVRAGKTDDAFGRLVPERFSLMADALPILIAYLDREQHYVYGNAAFERWFGVRKESLIGRRMGELLSAEVYEGMSGYVASVLDGRMIGFEMEVPFKNAGPRQVYVRLVPDVLPSGDIPGFFVLTEDVTEQRQALARLRQREDEQRQQQKMEALGSLATGIAHEFNNLLQAIVMGCQVLRHENLERRLRIEQVERVLRTARRGLSLTRQLLSLGRQKSLDDRPIALDNLLADMSILLAPLLGSRIELRSRLDSGCGIFADAGQVQQIVMNLAINARDAMPDGGCLRIETRVLRLDEAEASELGLSQGPHVSLTVTDSGPGMDEATRQRIFDPFFTTKPEGRGTGLGLSTVLGIVQAMRGHIDVRSAPGQGSCFRLLFPCLENYHADDVAHTDEGDGTGQAARENTER